MSEVRIATEPRTEFGKGAARRVRRADMVPAVIYGHGSDPRHVALPGHQLMMALKTPNVLLQLEGLGDDAELALPRGIQRDPIRGDLEHIDLLLVRRGEKVVVEVPIVVSGDPSPDGMVDQQLMTVSLEAEATRIPTEIAVSIEGFQVGRGVHAGELPLPPGAALHTDSAALIVHVMAAPTAEEIDAELSDAEAELGAGTTTPEEEEAAKEAAEGEGTSPEPTGEGDVVPDTDSGQGGPGEGQTSRG